MFNQRNIVKHNFSVDDEDPDSLTASSDSTMQSEGALVKVKKNSGMGLFDDFSTFYAEGVAKNSRRKAKCLISSTNGVKIFWDLYIMFLLMLVSVIVPYRLAFTEEDEIEWVLTYFIIDGFFLLDIILTFFTTF